jgi:diadenosine tetraphosphate (Ap4A) HIT family hydrolase
MSTIEFELDSTLDADSTLVCTLKLCQLRLIDDARFDWLMLVPMRANKSEWFELEPIDQQQLHRELMAVASQLQYHSACKKINIGALGNVVSQLHIHVIARNPNDDCWPKPVWGTPMQRRADALKTLALQRWQRVFSALTGAQA